MRNTRGQNVCPKCNSVYTPDDARHASKKVKKHLDPAEVALLEFINFQDTLQIIKALEWVHDTALYHSHSFIEEEEKFILFNVKLLTEKLKAITLKV